MKLKCDKHKRRVMRVVETHFTHRSDGTKCTGPTATIGTTSNGHGFKTYRTDMSLVKKEK